MDRAIADAYGTEKIAIPEKWSPLKGGLPLAALVGGALLYAGAHRGARNDAARASMEDRAGRALEANRLAGTTAALRGGVPLSQPGYALYSGEMADSNVPGDFSMFDKNASLYGVAAGVVLAKHAGIGSMAATGLSAVKSKLPSLGWKSKALIGAGLVGGGLLAAKGARTAYSAGMAQPKTQTWGGHNAALPTAVNEYGQSVMG